MIEVISILPNDMAKELGDYYISYMNIKLFVFTLSLSLITIPSFSQNKATIDSLENAIRFSDGNAKIDLMTTLSWELYNSQPNQSLEMIYEALKLSEEKNYLKGKGDSFNIIGIWYLFINGQYDSAQIYFEKSLIIKHELNDETGKAKIYNNMAIIKRREGDLSGSLDFYLQAISINEKTNSIDLLSSNYLNVGILYESMGYYELAEEYLYKTVTICEKMDYKLTLSRAFTTLGSINLQKSNNELARKYYTKSLKIKQQHNDIRGMAILYAHLGDAEQFSGNFDASKEYYLKSFELSSEHNFRESLCYSYIGLAISELHLNNLNAAETNGLKALALAKESDDVEEIIETYYILTLIYAAKRDFDKSNEFRNAFSVQNKKRFRDELKTQIAEIKIRYETEKREQEFALQEKENISLSQSLTIRNLIILVILLVIVTLLITYRYHSKLLLRNIDSKNRELAFAAIRMNKVNEIIDHIKKEILSKEVDDKDMLGRILKALPDNSEKDWNNLRIHFEQVHPNFFKKLQSTFEDLSQNELKLCAYIKVNLSNKEIANILHVTPQSVKMSKYRLKKKIGLNENKDLNIFISKF